MMRSVIVGLNSHHHTETSLLSNLVISKPTNEQADKYQTMDHSHHAAMDHSHMDHGDMGGGHDMPMCSMNVSYILSYPEASSPTKEPPG
jgi:hypothetical protein